MFRMGVLDKKSFKSWCILAAILISLVALLPQVDLWIARGRDWKGSYAITASDEPAYAAYLQSIIDGKPRRNSPYTGKVDTAEIPQKESLFSIQFFSTYPLAFVSRVFGFSSSTAMILLSIVSAFASACAVFWLVFLLSDDATLSFVVTSAVLLSGWISAEPFRAFPLSSSDPENFEHPAMLFLRRTNPAVSFPVLFLFFVSVWKFLEAKTYQYKILFCVTAVLSFTATVYSYFYHWTTALTWFLVFVILWTTFQFDHLRKNVVYFAGFSVAALLSLVPYFMLVSNRSSYMDSIQLLAFTREFDLWRVPELISYFTIVVILLSYKYGWLDLEKSKCIFLLSLALVAPIIFNQQVLTGRSLQPVHYQRFCVNYISSFTLIATVFLLLAKKLNSQKLKRVYFLVTLTAVLIGNNDVFWGNHFNHETRIWIDELAPAAKRIKGLSESPEDSHADGPSITFSFDLLHASFPDASYLPGLSSQPTLWSVYTSTFPDVDVVENTDRLNAFIYYHGFDDEQLKKSLETNYLLPIGFFGLGRVIPSLTTGSHAVAENEIDEVVRQYEAFRSNFSYEAAKRYPLSFVLVRNNSNNDFSAIDRWYDRDSGEVIGPYTLYRVKLRNP